MNWTKSVQRCRRCGNKVVILTVRLGKEGANSTSEGTCSVCGAHYFKKR